MALGDALIFVMSGYGGNRRVKSVNPEKVENEVVIPLKYAELIVSHAVFAKCFPPNVE